MAHSEHPHNLNRRAFVRRAGLVGAAAILPVAGATQAYAADSAADPEVLFKAGRFADADRGYARVLRAAPANARALAQRGYIALLSNRFGYAERFLTGALAVAPGDVPSAQRLAECYVRQDAPARAIPLLRSTGRQRDLAYAELYSHVIGTPWRIGGAAAARVPFLGIDPVPSVEASLNGGPPKGFLLDTYATLDLSAEAAEEAGVRAVATISGIVDGQTVTLYLGILDSFRIGGIEIRNIPVQWNEVRRPPLPDGSAPAGAFGTTLFYHFLTTMDYAGRALGLRRKTPTQQREFTAQAARAQLCDRLPLWLAGDHFPCTVGSLLDHGPRVVTVDTGGIASAFDTTVEIAERAGIDVDYAHPVDRPGPRVYPATADRISLGRAIGRNVRGHAAEAPFPGFPGPGQSGMFGFDLIANFTHEFFKPYAITFDYDNMHLFITGATHPRS
ncbi:aspartyl protease family protein [Streptodolium elevatio]|uniref:Aspartyl protease family protein n=1 Tax=Streptodolium elevatio TaxID=3157996 RepID=A0ABV3DIX0_9ACTN